jgi:hypothetical protein
VSGRNEAEKISPREQKEGVEKLMSKEELLEKELMKEEPRTINLNCGK